MSSNKKTIKSVLLNSSIYTVTTVFQKAVGFILLPLYTIYLTPKDYGITGIVSSITQVLSLLFTLSLNASVQRYYYIYEDDEQKRKGFFGTIILFVLLNSMFFGIVIIFFKDILIEPFIENIAFYPYLYLGILTVMVNPIYTIYQALLQTMQKAKSFALNSIGNFIALVVLNIIFIVVFKLGAVGQLVSALIVGIIYCIYSMVSLYSKKMISFEFNVHYLKEALSYSVPLLPHLMSTSISNLISRVLLNNKISTVSAGLFNVASQFTSIIDTIQLSVNSAYIPWFYSIMGGEKEDRNQIIKFADLLCRINLIISLIMAFFIKETLQIFINESFLISWTIVPIMLVSFQIRQIYYFYVNTLFYNTSATKYIFIATLTGSLLNIIISATTTAIFGLYTPSVALLIQNLLVTMIVIYLSKKIEPIGFRLFRMIFYVFYLAIIMLVGLYFDWQEPLMKIRLGVVLYKIILILVSIILLFKNDFKPLKIAIDRKFKQ